MVHNSQESRVADDPNQEMKGEVDMEQQLAHPQEMLELPITGQNTSKQKSTEGAAEVLDGNRMEHEENGFVVKSEPFDPIYEMGDVLMNGSADSIMDMPLFHEVDSLMNIKHEDHLNDTVFYLPMSYPLDNGIKIEVDNAQVAEVTRTLANELAAPGALVYVSPDQNKTVVAQHVVKQETVEQGVSEFRDQVHSSCPGSIIIGQNCENGPLQPVTRMTPHTSPLKQENGHASARELSGKSVKRSGKKAQDTYSSKVKVPKKKNIVKDLNRQSSQSSCSLSDSSDEVSSPAPNDCSELGAVQHMVADDPPEIDRFVICSDHTMECVLCAFTTDSYSAFKSHIICSHPCWRITKKLSKNRLLVERSVKASTSVFNHSDQTELRTTKSGSATTTLHAKVDQELQKVLRKYEKNPRKRQLFERNKRLFKCTICLRLFVFEGSVVNHVTDQHGVARPYEQIHISNDHGQKFGPIYRCSQKNCYFSCESDNELERHILERHTQVMYRCQLCGFTEDSAEAVRNHGLCMHQQQLTCSDSTL